MGVRKGGLVQIESGDAASDSLETHQAESKWRVGEDTEANRVIRVE